METYWENKLLIWRAKKFHNMVMTFCKQHNIPQTFEAFLHYETINGWVSDTYKYLPGAPKLYLVNSKAFQKYYNSLDVDFQNDIFTKAEMRVYKQQLILNYKLEKELKKIMKDDSIGG